MVMDFGFLKALMMQEIHAPMDHGLILYNKDPILESGAFGSINPDYIGLCDKHPSRMWLKLYLLDTPPTAECLARHWYSLMIDRVLAMTQGRGRLEYVQVHETPNSIAIYPASKGVTTYG